MTQFKHIPTSVEGHTVVRFTMPRGSKGDVFHCYAVRTLMGMSQALCADTAEEADRKAEALAKTYGKWPEGQKAITWVRPPYCGSNAIVK